MVWMICRSESRFISDHQMELFFYQAKYSSTYPIMENKVD